MSATAESLAELRRLVAAHARPDLRTPIPGLLLSKVDQAPPDYSLTEPLLVLLAQGAKRLLLGDRVFEYRPDGSVVRQIGLADSGLAHVGRTISWIRDNFAEPVRVADLAWLAGMSPSAPRPARTPLACAMPAARPPRVSCRDPMAPG